MPLTGSTVMMRKFCYIASGWRNFIAMLNFDINTKKYSLKYILAVIFAKVLFFLGLNLLKT